MPEPMCFASAGVRRGGMRQRLENVNVNVLSLETEWGWGG